MLTPLEKLREGFFGEYLQENRLVGPATNICFDKSQSVCYISILHIIILDHTCKCYTVRRTTSIMAICIVNKIHITWHSQIEILPLQPGLNNMVISCIYLINLGEYIELFLLHFWEKLDCFDSGELFLILGNMSESNLNLIWKSIKYCWPFSYVLVYMLSITTTHKADVNTN